MIVFLRKFLIFTGAAFLIYITIFGVLFFVRSYNIPMIFRTSQGNIFRGGYTYVTFRQFDRNAKYDIILLGSSHAYRGYDPTIFREHGYNMFNLGTNSQTNLVSYFIAKNYIKKENCKTVIIDVYDRVFLTTTLESISDIVQNINSNKAAVEICFALKDIRTVNMLSLRLFNNFNGVFDDDTAGVVNGFIPYITQLKITDRLKEPEFETLDQAIDYFDKLVDCLQKEGIKVIVAEHPVPFIYAISKEQHALLVEKIKPILNRYNVPFYDHLYDSTMTDLQYYANANHLSISGIKKYNDILLEELKRDGHLPR